MKVSELGGEFAFISRIARNAVNDPRVIKGIGDDCAVLSWNDESHLLVTTDMMVEGDHFSLDWFSPEQVGGKLMESNVSDITSKGGTPLWAFLSMSLRSDTSVEFLDALYAGLYASAERHGVLLLGGDTTHGPAYVFNIALLGNGEKELIRLRSGARPGELIAVTGTLGGSTAGLKLLLAGKDGFLKDHLEPRARTAVEGAAICRFAGATIDVSDGLASEVNHICAQSGTGAAIERESIPLSGHTVQSAESLGHDPYDYALYGGEDFQIVFTIREENIPLIKKVFTDFTVVGRVTEKEEGVTLLDRGRIIPMGKGYDHFS